MTPELYAIIGVGLALAGLLVPASNRHSRDIAELRQEMNQQGQQVNQEIAGLRQQVNHETTGLRQEMNRQGQQINQIAQQVGHLAGLLEGLRGRPITEPEEIRV